jgi:hypothetical protein
MDRHVTPDEERPGDALDAYYRIVSLPQPPQRAARELSAYVEHWGEDEDRAVLLGFVQALGWAEDPLDGDARDATLDREVIRALATEVMCRYWRVELLCERRGVDPIVSQLAAGRYRLLPASCDPRAGATWGAATSGRSS